MKFDWDPTKNQSNKGDHDGIGFEDAQHIFDGPVLSRLDRREDYGEDREIAYGAIGIGTVLAVVFTERGDTIRIISARKATRSETRDMPISKKRLAEIEAIKDEDIDCTDIPEAGPDFWANAKLRIPRTKKGVYLHLDSDILEWLKAQGPGYQTKINAILRTYMERAAT